MAIFNIFCLLFRLQKTSKSSFTKKAFIQRQFNQNLSTTIRPQIAQAQWRLKTVC